MGTHAAATPTARVKKPAESRRSNALSTRSTDTIVSSRPFRSRKPAPSHGPFPRRAARGNSAFA